MATTAGGFLAAALLAAAPAFAGPSVSRTGEIVQGAESENTGNEGTLNGGSTLGGHSGHGTPITGDSQPVDPATQQRLQSLLNTVGNGAKTPAISAETLKALRNVAQPPVTPPASGPSQTSGDDSQSSGQATTGGAGGSGASGTASGGGAPVAAVDGSAPASAPAAKAFAKAQRLGEQLKSGLRSAEELAPGATGLKPGADGGLPGGAGRKPGAADPSDPKTPGELAMAGTTGFKGAFDALGMKTAQGPGGATILDRDGKPASAARLAELAERVRAEPKALMTRPDFFSVIPRERFNGLKSDFQGKPELRGSAFKHMELSEPGERDFLRSQSCDKLSGSCNKFTVEMSYRKGDFVSPEDLKKAAEKIDAGEAEPTEEEKAALAEEARRLQELDGEPASRRVLDKSARKGIFARLNSVFGGIMAMLGGPAGGAGASAASAGAGTGTGTGWAGEAGGAQPQIPLQPGLKPRPAAAPPRLAAGPAGAASSRPAGTPARGPWVLAGAGALILLLVLLRRRD